MRKKKLQTYIHRLGENTGGVLLEHFYNDHISKSKEHFYDGHISMFNYKPSEYDWKIRYVWIKYGEKEGLALAKLIPFYKKLSEYGVFSEGPGWYTFIQTGPGWLESPYVAAVLKCKGRNEAYRVASRRSREKFTMDNLDIIRAKHMLLGY